jgi:signal peptidase II
MVKYFLTIIGLFTLDRLSKIYILSQPSLKQSGDGLFALHLNRNIAFSLPLPSFILYPIVGLILIILIYFWLKSFKIKNILLWPWGLLIIGALSNLLDRIRYGAIVDFINLPWFTVFNLADVYISLAAVWLLISLALIKQTKEI